MSVGHSYQGTAEVSIKHVPTRVRLGRPRSYGLFGHGAAYPVSCTNGIGRSGISPFHLDTRIEGTGSN